MPLSLPAGVTLTAPERRWAEALFETMLPSNADPRLPIGARDIDMVGRFERVLASNPLPAAWGARMAMALLQVLPLFLIGVPSLFRSLPSRHREECLRRCAEHRVYVLREVFALVKSVALIAYFDDPRTVEALRRAV